MVGLPSNFRDFNLTWGIEYQHWDWLLELVEILWIKLSGRRIWILASLA